MKSSSAARSSAATSFTGFLLGVAGFAVCLAGGAGGGVTAALAFASDAGGGGGLLFAFFFFSATTVALDGAEDTAGGAGGDGGGTDFVPVAGAAAFPAGGEDDVPTFADAAAVSTALAAGGVFFGDFVGVFGGADTEGAVAAVLDATELSFFAEEDDPTFDCAEGGVAPPTFSPPDSLCAEAGAGAGGASAVLPAIDAACESSIASLTRFWDCCHL